MDNLENIDVSNMDVSTMSKVIERLWPKFLDAGMNIVWAVLILIVGLKLISILRKFLKKTLLRGNVDTGVVQFVDALVKAIAYAVLLLTIISLFGTAWTFWHSDYLFYYDSWIGRSCYRSFSAGKPLKLRRWHSDSDYEAFSGRTLYQCLWM